ncbi:hypothetical protein GTQ99_04740 [Kineococcus sp. T13]|nr:hypothetical protein [Kineococcus vitellinus]
MPVPEGVRCILIHPLNLPLLTCEDEHAPLEAIQHRGQLVTGADEVAGQFLIFQPEALQQVVRRRPAPPPQVPARARPAGVDDVTV